jgi:hypothetical protein
VGGRELLSCCVGVSVLSMGVDPDTQTKRTSLTQGVRGRGVLQIVIIKITPCIEHKGRVIIIKIMKIPHLHKTQAKGRVLL